MARVPAPFKVAAPLLSGLRSVAVAAAATELVDDTDATDEPAEPVRAGVGVAETAYEVCTSVNVSVTPFCTLKLSTV